MKTKSFVIVLLASSLLTAAMFSIMSTLSTKPYNPWMDVDNNGKIDMIDLWLVQQSYGAMGTPVGKAALLYDSGWIDITDKCGQDINITHNLNSVDIMVDVTGKITIGGGFHQKHLGLTGYTPGWSKTYGGTGSDEAHSVIQTSDGGYAIAGSTNSSGAGGYDFWLVKTDICGHMEWSTTYGGASDDFAHAVVQTADGGYALAGYTLSFDVGMDDFWLVKTDGNGNMQWNKTYGGTGYDVAWAVIQTADGGYALAGGIGGSRRDSDFWLVKTDSAGNVEWNKTYAGIRVNRAYSVVQTVDGGYALAGFSFSFPSGSDFWLVKTDALGNAQWNKTYGGTGYNEAWSLVQTGDGGYALAGYTDSFGAGNGDFWLVKTDASGNVLWDKTYGGIGDDVAGSLVQTGDGGYALAGYTDSFGAGGYDSWLVKTDALGNAQWNKTYGGTGDDVAGSLVQTGDGGYALAGYTDSFGAGNGDFWLVKTDVESGLALVDSTANSITIHRGTTDAYWNFVRIQIWQKQTP